MSIFCYQDHTYDRVYTLMVTAGLTHLVVVDKEFQVRGIVTRGDLARYQEWGFWGNYGFHRVTRMDNRDTETIYSKQQSPSKSLVEDNLAAQPDEAADVPKPQEEADKFEA